MLRTILLMLIFFISLTGFAQGDFVTTDAQGFRVGGQPFVPRGVNYYPARAAWSQFWLCYDTAIVDKDLQLVHRLGFNSIRIFVGYNDLIDSMGRLMLLSHLCHFLHRARLYRLKTIVTLFDFLGEYTPGDNSKVNWELQLLLTTFRSDPAVLAWDIKNEPDLDFARHGRDTVVHWLGSLLRYARQLDPNHLLTIGWAYPADAGILQDSVDFVSFHSYVTPRELDSGITALRRQVVAKPLLLEEFGYSTYTSKRSMRHIAEQSQADYFVRVRKIAREQNELPWMVWTLYDFRVVPPGVAGTAEQRQRQSCFGILRGDSSKKPGVSVLTP